MNKYLPDPLPEEEWDFSRYKTEFEITQAFYYEYFRSCKETHPLIIGGRHFWGSPVPFSETEKLNMSQEEYLNAIKKLPGGQYIEFLSAIPEFPEKPLSKCEELGIKTFIYGHHTSPEGIRVYDKSYFEGTNPDFKHMEEISKCMYSNPFYGKNGYGLPAIVFMGINWGCTDKEIMEDFQKLLKQERPKKFQGLKHPLQRGLKNIVLPFRKDTALEWLGVWRRKEMGSTTSWEQFIDLYEPDYNHPNRPKFAKKDSRITTLKNMNTKAKKVLRWFAGKNTTF